MPGDNCKLRSHAVMDGHVVIGGVMMHPFRRIDRLAMAGSSFKTAQDVPPAELK